MSRTIIHLDLDAFFCAVEELRDLSLRGRPFAVGGRPEVRGVVASCSYAARRFGIRSAMPMAKALKLCPDLVILPGRYSDYSRFSRQVMDYLKRITPLVEQISIDEAFLDVSDLTEQGVIIARRLQQAIQDDMGLPCSLGVASNKMVAKIATDAGKAATPRDSPPNAITVVPPGEEAEFLKPMPVEALWGVGPKTAARLAELGIHTIGDLAEYPQTELRKLFGKNGLELSRHAQGIDERPIYTSHEIKSISQETTFPRDINNESELLRTIQSLSNRVADRLKKTNLSGSTIKIKIRWPDFTTITRQVTLAQATDQEEPIFEAAVQLFSKEWRKHKAVRLLGVGVSNLQHGVHQLSLWEINSDREQRLQMAMYSLHHEDSPNQRDIDRNMDQDD